MGDETAVGQRVRVFWKDEDEWFEGVVAAFDSESGYFVRYDDGEEQWEPMDGAIEFLSSQSDSTADSEPAIPSPSYSQHEFEDDGGSDRDEDGQDEDCAGQKDPDAHHSCSVDDPPSSTPSSNVESIGQRRREQHKPTARALKGGGAPFFRDQDTLREMKRALEAERQELTRGQAALEEALADQERESVAVRRELQQLKTQVSLTSALHYASSPSHSRSWVPTTPAEWKQRAMDLKLDNQQLQHDIVALKTASQTQQQQVKEQSQRVEQLRAKVSRVPKRELLTLADLQVEIAQLLQRKRKLEEDAARDSNQASMGNPRLGKRIEDQSEEEARRTVLEKQLARLERELTQSQKDARAWRTRLECERARLQPMRERLEGLRAELLTKYQASDRYGNGGDSVLLRSLFLRLDADGDAAVDVAAAREAFALLLGDPSDDGSQASMTAPHGDGHTLSFDQFVDAFDRVSSHQERR